MRHSQIWCVVENCYFPIPLKPKVVEDICFIMNVFVNRRQKLFSREPVLYEYQRCSKETGLDSSEEFWMKQIRKYDCSGVRRTIKHSKLCIEHRK